MRQAVVMLLCLALTGCGSSEPADEPSPATELRIVLWPTGRDGEKIEAALTCEPAGGTHPHAAGACAALARERDALDPVPPDTMCTQEFGGPEEADVTGTVDGERVEARLARTNGCELDRWHRLEPLLSLSKPT
ncbi:MAG: SSI family serine proteinase inhibitor [Actinomycetota bacterium]|nr:SSI family serine proteinase inhibitor [Actinomycetota bacterium]